MEEDSDSHYTDEGVRVFMTAVVTVLAQMDILHPQVQLVEEFTERLEALTPSASAEFPKLLLEEEGTVLTLTHVFLATLSSVSETLQQRMDDA